MASGQILTAKTCHGAGEPAFVAGFVGEKGGVQLVPHGMPSAVRSPGKGDVSIPNGHFQSDRAVFRNRDIPIRRGITLADCPKTKGKGGIKLQDMV